MMSPQRIKMVAMPSKEEDSMGKSKVVYRDLSSNRLITRQQAAKRDPETWVEETFTRSEKSRDAPTRTDLPSVRHF